MAGNLQSLFISNKFNMETKTAGNAPAQTEKIPVKSNRMYALIVLYDMHTKFFANVLDGISDKDTHTRLNTKANHIAWLTGTLVHERFELVKAFGKNPDNSNMENPKSKELFKDHKGIQDNVIYPTLAEFKKDWETISPVLRKILINASDEQLDSLFEMMPGEVMTNFDLISFMIYREANCIGQIALWRRLLGYEAMKYQ